VDLLERHDEVSKTVQDLIFQRDQAKEFLYEELAMAKDCEYKCSLIRAKIKTDGRNQSDRDNELLLLLDGNKEYQVLFKESLEHRRSVNDATKNIELLNDGIKIGLSELQILANLAQVN
jgi:hypothetical protein|tara:strand:+ start:5387 stop:5743 length:357 start_codon:yes stop_codon:yes gene_type:complete